MKSVLKLAAALVVVALAGCSSTSPDVIQRGDAQRLSSVQDAVVLNVRPVVVDGSQSGFGAGAGAVIGGLAGYGTGSGNAASVAAAAGAVVGGVIGNTVERAATKEGAIEILVQLRNGERRAIVQAQASETFKAGDEVVLVSTGSTTRVTRAQAVQPTP